MNELDLILGHRPSLQIYLVKEGEKWLPIESVEPVIGSQLTRVLQLSHDSRKPQDRGAEIGERLTYHEPSEVGYWVRPSEWVVIKVFCYEADITGLSELPEFRDIEIAYCEKRALLPVEIEELSYEIQVKPLAG